MNLSTNQHKPSKVANKKLFIKKPAAIMILATISAALITIYTIQTYVKAYLYKVSIDFFEFTSISFEIFSAIMGLFDTLSYSHSIRNLCLITIIICCTIFLSEMGKRNSQKQRFSELNKSDCNIHQNCELIEQIKKFVSCCFNYLIVRAIFTTCLILLSSSMIITTCIIYYMEFKRGFLHNHKLYCQIISSANTTNLTEIIYIDKSTATVYTWTSKGVKYNTPDKSGYISKLTDKQIQHIRQECAEVNESSQF